jgi:hypothetical protein
MKSIKDVFLFSLPYILDFILIQSIIFGITNASARCWILIWVLCGFV